MKTITRTTFGKLAASAMLVLLSGAALAQSASADGVVRKVDAEAGRVVIKHGEWTGMHMGAMTMAFKVRPVSLLDGLKVSDKVHFAIAQEGNDFVITAIERAAQDASLAVVSTAVTGN